MKRNGPTMRSAFAALWILSLNKSELHSLIDDVKRDDADATARAIDFVVAESFGMWHNRARAKLCRHFKNHPPPAAARNRLLDAIVERLLEGRFFEQFKDQLSMAIRFDPDRMAEAAIVASNSDRAYVRRYADWIHHVLASSTKIQIGG